MHGSGAWAQPRHLLADSAGSKLCGADERLVDKHDTSTRRSWRRLHLSADAGIGQMAAALTNKEIYDAAQVGRLLDQVAGSLASVTTDGAYDQDGVYADVAKRHPDAAVIGSPRCYAVLSEQAATAPTKRDRHLHCIAGRSRVAWQQVSGYKTRAKVKAAIGRWNRVISDRLRSRIDEGRLLEASVAVDVLDRMLGLGRLNYVRIVWSETEKGINVSYY